MTKESELRGPSAWSYIVCYGLWAVLAALCYTCFWVWRSTSEVVLAFLLRRSHAFAAVYLGTAVLIGVVLFAVVVGGEGYLRNGLNVRGDALGPLVRRFARLTWPLLLALALAFALQELVYWRMGV